jgi:hypothetical protein
VSVGGGGRPRHHRRHISRSPPFAFVALDFILNRSSDVTRKSSRHRRNLAHSVAVFRSRARCRIAKAVYAPVSMTDLKVSVTASIGMQARHRTQPLSVFQWLWGILRLLTEFWWTPFRRIFTSLSTGAIDAA